MGSESHSECFGGRRRTDIWEYKRECKAGRKSHLQLEAWLSHLLYFSPCGSFWGWQRTAVNLQSGFSTSWNHTKYWTCRCDSLATVKFCDLILCSFSPDIRFWSLLQNQLMDILAWDQVICKSRMALPKLEKRYFQVLSRVKIRLCEKWIQLGFYHFLINICSKRFPNKPDVL